ncbi:MAG: hypothetical protein HYV27_12775 [Candidatus Hydrogenedentes bacterium]|nr:hypothetical protein [Candidatus Hydrogenedentota bacterium]
MAQAEIRDDHLTDYERAICYYTLPKLNNPVTFGLIVAYAVCLFEALGVLVVGALRNNSTWIAAGLIATAAIVLFGIVVFLVRAFLTELRRRRALAEAQGVPDHSDSFQDFDLPDPFASHILLKHPASAPQHLFACTEDDATIRYFVESVPGENWWRIKSVQDTEVCRVRSLLGPRPFAFNSGRPRKLGVYLEDRELATIERPFGFALPSVEIVHRDPAIPRYAIRNSGIYVDDRLVGRLYELRNSYYLDVENAHFHPGVLAYYATLT